MGNEKKRIGLFFGSFNPIHKGHLAIARKCIEDNIVDEFRFVPAVQNPFKSEYELSFFDRRGLIILSIIDEALEGVKVDTVEFDIQDPTHRTYNALNAIKSERYADSREYLIVCGDDVFDKIPTWYKGDEILAENKFIVFKRNNDKIMHPSIDSYIDMSGYEDVSSSKIKSMIKNNEDVSKYLTKRVISKINTLNIFK